MKGKAILGIFSFMWICMLVYMAFFSNSTHLNFVLFFFGLLFTICGFAYGCEELEKNTNDNQ